jgi:hypothetical protein
VKRVLVRLALVLGLVVGFAAPPAAQSKQDRRRSTPAALGKALITELCIDELADRL